MSEPVASTQTLYSKLGGEGTVKTLVEQFYRRVVADAELGLMFRAVDMGRLKRHQALFISQALGGPKQYDGREMAAAHANLRITDRHFDRVAGHLDAAMEGLGVEAADRAVVIQTVASLRKQIVNVGNAAPQVAVQKAPAAPQAAVRKAPASPQAVVQKAPAKPAALAPKAGPSLYERLGGEATIKAVVDEFYRRILADRSLSPVFAGVDMGPLKRHQALFISQALGGPKQYDGRDMKRAHQHLDITNAQFDAVAGHLVGTLKHFKVGAGDINTIIGAIAPLRSDVVADPFLRWLRAG